jgi:hypothetical protein
MEIKSFIPEKTPDWFSLPSGIFHDFWRNPKFPKGFKPPNNKYFVGELMMPYDIENLNGKNPLLSCGFTHVAPNTRPHSAVGEPKNASGQLVNDTLWCDTNDGRNTSKWSAKNLIEVTKSVELLFLDYEHQNAIINEAMIKKMAELNAAVEKQGSKMALWAQGLVNSHPMYMPETGAQNEGAARYWAEKYRNPRSSMNTMVAGANLKISMPFGYYLSYSTGEYIYSLMQAHEVGKLINPKIISMPTLWIQQEHVDNYATMDLEINRTKGGVLRRKVKLQAPATYVYSTALWGAVWDGWYHFELGRGFSDDPNLAAHYDGEMPYPTKRFKGANIDANYPNKYFGYYNYVYLALWQMSLPQNKAIIEAKTVWQIPDYKSDKSLFWRTGDERLPGFGHLRKEPIIRYKYNEAKTEALIIAQNPYNSGYETVKIRDSQHNWEAEITLEGGWAMMGIVKL